MLDNGTKNRINTARDILVGKVPDPKAQVEQITTALIYKFMHDMDQESVELGGEPSFFVEEYAQFRWSQLMDKRLGGYQRLDLYVQAITRMGQNPHIPQLFRDIFKDAFLPYRDPETLNLFLKEIDGFTYDHSEKLGDAFEYLLSILGSQGAAGQFRTPRHIIDFIVQAVAPTKTDTILDPACGTAGFLISAYKYIMAQNAETPLSPDERQRLTRNFVGYDISPDMVRLSLVNMYLHQFRQPTIYEYDTLTSEDRWDDSFDVILANPPFMSPKGGIRPHQRFAIQSSRSEVLFVDYIAEHLNPHGRAGVIVPEGVIFQSNNAYKSLRKMLVDEHYLWAVVSLPAGVFQPYSGVKTSILLMDKTLARRAKRILFVDVQNDGFDLGAQRREIGQDDLPQALGMIQAYQAHPGMDVDSSLAHAVPKEKIAEDGDYNLTGGRYKTVSTSRQLSYPLVAFEEILEINRATENPEQLYGDNEFIYIDISSVENGTGNVNFENMVVGKEAPSRARRVVKNGDILLSTVRPNLKAFAYLQDIPHNTLASTGFAVLTAKEIVLPRYVYYQLFTDFLQQQMINRMGKGSYPSINQKDVSELKIPLPPIEVQRAIVAEIDSYQVIIDGARQVVENYTPRIQIDPEWPIQKLDNLLTFVSSGATPLGGKSTYLDQGILFIRSQNILVGKYDFSDAAYISADVHKEMSRSQVKQGDVFLNITGASIGRSAFMNLDIDANVNQHVAILRTTKELDAKYLSHFLNSQNGQAQIFGIQSGASRQALNYSQIKSLKIPLPPIETQQSIVKDIEKEQALVESNRQLIDIFQAKIDASIARVWGE